MKGIIVNLSRGICAALLLALFTACALQIAPDYDTATANQIVATAKVVDKFYADLNQAPDSDRPYSKYAPEYGTVEVEIRALVLRNKMRALNEDSSTVADTLLTLWQKVESTHKTKDAYPTVLANIDQERIDGLLQAMGTTEGNKNQQPAGK